MWTEARRKMEVQATAITNAEAQKAKAIDENIEKIKEINRSHPISAASIITLYQAEPESETIDTIAYNAAYFVLTQLFPEKRKRIKK